MTIYNILISIIQHDLNTIGNVYNNYCYTGIKSIGIDHARALHNYIIGDI